MGGHLKQTHRHYRLLYSVPSFGKIFLSLIEETWKVKFSGQEFHQVRSLS